MCTAPARTPAAATCRVAEAVTGFRQHTVQDLGLSSWTALTHRETWGDVARSYLVAHAQVALKSWRKFSHLRGTECFCRAGLLSCVVVAAVPLWSPTPQLLERLRPAFVADRPAVVHRSG